MPRYLLFLVTLLCFSCTSRKDESVTQSYQSGDSTVITIISDDPLVSDEVDTGTRTDPRLKVNRMPLSPKKNLSLDSLLNAHSKSAFRAVVDTKRDTTLKLPEGTILKIPAFAFRSRSGAVDNVALSIKEFYTMSDIVLANLTTTTKHEMLETGGMIYIGATCGGEECALETEKEIEISFPMRGKKQEGMELFTGTRDSADRMMWTPLSDLTASDELIISLAEDTPEFPGGYDKLYAHLRKTLKYPKDARRKAIEGTVFVRFIIDESGAVTQPSVVRGVDKSIDQAALDAIAGMPRWIPARENGKPVKSTQTLPLRFSLGGGSLPGTSEPFTEKVVANFQETYTDSTLEMATEDDLLYHIFKTAKLGWINCDRFVEVKQKVTFTVKVPGAGDGDTDVKLIFDKYRSIMFGSRVGSSYHFADVPKGEKATLLAIRSTSDGLEMTTRKVKMTAVPDSVMNFERVTVEKLADHLDQLDNN